jgi:hypothetical protein
LCDSPNVRAPYLSKRRVIAEKFESEMMTWEDGDFEFDQIKTIAKALRDE